MAEVEPDAERECPAEVRGRMDMGTGMDVGPGMGMRVAVSMSMVMTLGMGVSVALGMGLRLASGPMRMGGSMGPMTIAGSTTVRGIISGLIVVVSAHVLLGGRRRRP